MSEDQTRGRIDQVLELVRAAEHSLVAEPNESAASRSAGIRSTLDRAEAATPGGAPLHAQLDNVRKWLAALDRPADHERFGGTAYLRDYVVMQLRLARAALEDYRREME
jgi:hypothetical protein